MGSVALILNLHKGRTIGRWWHDYGNLRIVGLDFITPDIRRSHREVGGAFNEFNSAPMLSYVLGLEYDTLSSIEVLRRCLEL